MGRIESFKNWWNGTTADATGDASTGGEGMKAPSRAEAGRGVSVAEALALPMVYRAIQIHAIAGKQLSIDTYRNGFQIEDHDLTRRPDPTMSRSSWIEQSIVSLASTGNCYYEIIGDVLAPSALPILNPLDVRIATNREGKTTGYTYRGRDIPAARIKHLTLLRVPGTAYGLGPIQAAQPDLRGAIDTRDYAANWLDAGGQPNGILKSDQILNPEQAAQAKKSWNDTTGAKKGVAVLGQGLTYTPVFLSPKDVQFIEAQQFNVTSIARMFGTPASLMLAAVEGNSQTYSNVEQDWLAYVRFTLMGYLVEIEEALSALLPGRQRAKFNIEALLRADTTTRYLAHKTALDAGFLTDDEVRAIENRAPLTDAERENIRARKPAPVAPAPQENTADA